jgi:hypothetical protein
MKKENGELQEFVIDVKLKLSALWVSLMFCYVYGDFFTLFVPGRVNDLANGESGIGETTPLKLLLFAMLMTVPSVMVFLSLVLRPTINRWLNIALGSFYTGIMILVALTSITIWMIFYVYLAVVEIMLTSLIVYYSWRWPRREDSGME